MVRSLVVMWVLLLAACTSLDPEPSAFPGGEASDDESAWSTPSIPDEAPAVGEEIGQVQVRINGLPGMLDVQVDVVRRAHGQVVLAEQVVVEIRALYVTAGLTGEMVHLAVDEPAELDLQRVHAP